MEKVALRVEGLDFEVGGHRILDSVSLEIGRGERISIIGPNGAGKTTLLRCMMRLVVKTSGRISVFGEDIDGMSQKRLASMVGYVPQQPVTGCPFSVRDFVLLSRYPHLSPFSRVGKEDVEAVEDALAATGNTELSERSFDTLSGGEKQMVSIASVLAQGAGILLLDEPAAYLDPRHSRRINDLIESLRLGMGMTVVSVTHDLNDALLGGGKLLLLSAGRAIYTGDAGGVLEEGMLERLYGRDFEYSVHPSTGSMFVLPDAGRRP